MAIRYHQSGFVTVIDDFWDPHQMSDYQPLFQHPCIHKVVLYPSQHEAHRRNFQRSGDSPVTGYIDEGIRLIYSYLTPIVDRIGQDGWIVLDTTNISIDATVTQILQSVERKVDTHMSNVIEHAQYASYAAQVTVI
jgi:hypothetical protein